MSDGQGTFKASSPTPVAEAGFRAVLAPNRSLGPTGFLVLMGGIGFVSFVMGAAFLLIGAWPVLGFFGLDVALIYLAFRLNYRAGRQYEVIEIDGSRLTLTRVDPSGKAERFDFNPYWVNVRLARGRNGRTRLALASHGRELAFGGFLTDDERRAFADTLRGALDVARRSPYGAGNSGA